MQVNVGLRTYEREGKRGMDGKTEQAFVEIVQSFQGESGKKYRFRIEERNAEERPSETRRVT